MNVAGENTSVLVVLATTIFRIAVGQNELLTINGLSVMDG